MSNKNVVLFKRDKLDDTYYFGLKKNKINIYNNYPITLDDKNPSINISDFFSIYIPPEFEISIKVGKMFRNCILFSIREKMYPKQKYSDVKISINLRNTSKALLIPENTKLFTIKITCSDGIDILNDRLVEMG